MVDVVNGEQFEVNYLALNRREARHFGPAFHLTEKHDTFAYCRT